MDPLSTLQDKALDGAINWLQQEATYLFSYKSYVDNLDKKINRLHDERAQLEHQVEDEKRKGKEIEPLVENWLVDVNKIIEQHKEKIADQINTSFYNGLFPNPWSRYTLGKQAYEMAQEVDQLLEAKSKNDFVGWLEPISMESALYTIDYKSFDSRNEIIDKIKEKLKDASVGMIGVYGPGGVGKTTLVKKVASEFLDKFKVVVLASVTRNPDRKKIQGAIADDLGLRLEEESEIGRANRIHERLKKEKENTLIILDDLWDELDLNGLGIPVADGGFSHKTTMKAEGMPNLDYNMTEEKDKSPADQRMIKILLISRSKEVLSNQMAGDENSIFSIGYLNDTEAETLFKKVAKVTDKSPKFESLVAKIVNKCEGLPIAIITIGKALKGKSQHEWDEAVQQLERKGFMGMSESLEFSTRLSFNSLENEELKSAFLLCAQMGNDPLTVDLMKYCYGLSVFQGVHSIKEAQNRTLELIRKLQNLSLLMDSTSNDHLNMHDMVRDAALSISVKDRHVFTMRDAKLDEWPYKDELKRFSSISLCNCHISDDLPEDITFPELKFFHISSRHPFVRITDNFKGMGKLKVLILTDIHLPHLPFSDESIANGLRMLCLERCLLSDTDNLSIIGELKKLRILSFSGSRIEMLPKELGKLSNLQWFDISDCSQLRVIPPNVLSRLDNLEELYMRDCPIQWGYEGQPNCELKNATLAELSHLHQLTNLDVCIPDAAVLPRNLFLDVLDSYKIVIGDPELLSKGDFMMPKKHEASRALVLQLKEGLDIHTHKGIKMLLRRVEKLLLGELPGIDNVFYELNLEGFQYLKHFCIQNNNDIECIIDSKMSYPHDAFPNLESLCLYNLKNLKTICRIKLTDSSFGKLKSMKIRNCAQLNNIFPISVVRLLEKLETFEVSNCGSLKEIVLGEENADNNGEVVSEIQFPQLRSLTLQSLPAFNSFYADCVSTSHSIFSERVEIPNLETLVLSSINDQIQKIWNDQTPLDSFLRNLVKLNVDGCNGLTYLFSFSEAKNLENLKTISISKCNKMEKIFKPTEDKVYIFPKLEEISLTSMMSLSEIWHPQEVSVDPYPGLRSLIIADCEKLVTVFPHYMVRHFAHLERLTISRCSSVKEIFDLEDAPKNDEAGNETNLTLVCIRALHNLKHVWKGDPKGILSFKNIQRIEVTQCSNLKNLFPPSFAKGLENLDHLRIIDCPEMHHIVWTEGPETSDISWSGLETSYISSEFREIVEGSERSDFSFEFPRLTSVVFAILPTLESFHGGRHTLEWPSLKYLTVDACDKLDVFPVPTKTKNQDDRPIILAEKVISNLEFMGLGQKEAEGLRHFVDSYLVHRLKELRFYSLKSNAILYKILHRIPNLEKLTLYNCPLKELLPSGSFDEHEKIGTVIQIKDLTLNWMPNLESIGFEHDPVLQRAERLFLSGCTSLINLAPSIVSFTHLKSLEVSNCNKLSYLMGSSTARSLVKLTTMKISQCKAIEEIMAKEREEERVDKHDIVFRKLMTLELVSLENLTSFCNCKNHNLNFPVLEKLIVRKCPKLKIFSEGVTTTPILRQVNLAYAEEDGGKWLWERDLNAAIRNYFTDMGFLKYVIDLEFSRCPQLERVWHDQVSFPDNGFCNLKTLKVSNCGFLSRVIPFHLLAYLKKLEELRVSNCNLVEVVFDMNDTKMTKTGGKAVHLKTLVLHSLPNLKHVWNNDLKGLISFHNLQDVSVDRCKRLKTLFPKSVAKNLLKLDKLDVQICQELEEIVGKEDAAADGAIEMFEFPRLAELSLVRLPELKCFCPGRFNLKCPILKEAISWNQIISMEAQPLFPIQEVSLDPINTRTQSSVSFSNLKELKMKECDGLVFLFTPSAVKCLVRLQKIRVETCKSIKEIVANERDESDSPDEIIFEQLQELYLHSLLSLASFYPGSSTLKFPHLKQVSIIQCPRMNTFSNGIIEAPVLEEIQVSSQANDSLWVHDLNSTVDKLFSEKVFLKYAENLELSQYPELEQVWQGQVSFPDNNFCNLKILKVSNCDFLSSVIPFHLLAYLEKLEELQVSNCNLVEVIFDMNDTEMIKVEGKAFHLKNLSLDDLPNLKHVWNKDPKGLISFHNLHDVHVDGCKRLKTLFPKSVAKNLLKLEQLDIQNCGELEEIVGKGDAAADGAIDDMFEFPRLDRLLLSELPELKCFYPGRFNLKCPMLKELVVFLCGKLEIFTSESQSHEEAISHDQIISIEAGRLFPVHEDIPILRTVVLNKEDINLLVGGGLQGNLHKLEELWLSGFFHNVKETEHSLYKILQKVPSVKTLGVAGSGLKEIFNSVGSEHSTIDPILENLEALKVHGCPCLTKLIQSSVSFSNLKKLSISLCDGLIYVLTSSTVRSLVSLEKLYIKDCESIKEIVAAERNESDSPTEIIFEKLEVLRLYSLPNLASFYSGSCTLKFPYLEKVRIIQCPRMNAFSNGIIEAPELEEIQFSTEEDDLLWVHDLKSTVDKLFNEKVSFVLVEDLKLSSYPELEPLWFGKIPMPENCFSKLKTLRVENCEFLSIVIPSNLTPCLKSLEGLRVRNCSSVEVIFDINGIETSETKEQAFLLKKLTLDQLPNLKHVWNKNPQRIMDFQKLQKVKVSDCESLQYLFPAAFMAKHLLKLKVQNCGALVEILGKEDTASEESKTFEFPHLTTVILNHLPELNCFYPGRLNLKCPVLKVLNVYHGGKLEIYTSETKSNQAFSEDQIGVSVNAQPVFLVEQVTPKLEEISLNEKETMTAWHEESQAYFLHNIKCLQLYCFHSVTDHQEDILPYGFLHKVPNIEILAVACSDFEEIFPCRGLKDEYVRMLTKLKGLRLEALPKLNSIGLEHYAVSFSNLKELSVTKCHKLEYLFTTSTARSLVQLRRMSVEKCELMREILANEEKESIEDETVFGELKKLSLNNLSSLRSFDAGNSTLRFPYLEYVIIAQCSKMKVFSEGFTSSPRLLVIQASMEERDMHWEGDLNSTVSKLFKGTEVLAHP